MAEGERPEYHMTQMRAFSMTDTRETFIAGATAVRNARDLARRQREDFVQTAKDKVSQRQQIATVKHRSELQDDNLSDGHGLHAPKTFSTIIKLPYARKSSKSRSRFTTTRQPIVSPAAIGEPDLSELNVS
ncbi:hypothetical protein NOR_00955 [Metarhizium rileyi]|uniref:Uncharacterized protein n=1 Tax=Metarhizium rileyi (strain RCEF 4871) TaxID=1649241 RepID=A0A162I016_METRR|nr:hypothetical protein NOR_00955 [Metarhizium rileyi RCEF 4871]